MANGSVCWALSFCREWPGSAREIRMNRMNRRPADGRRRGGLLYGEYLTHDARLTPEATDVRYLLEATQAKIRCRSSDRNSGEMQRAAGRRLLRYQGMLGTSRQSRSRAT
jgi:hypothetical protein